MLKRRVSAEWIINLVLFALSLSLMRSFPAHAQELKKVKMIPTAVPVPKVMDYTLLDEVLKERK